MDAHDLIDRIAQLPGDWHGAGSVTRNVLQAILRHVGPLAPLQHSAETGSGRTTLLLSHLSSDHTVFAVDAGGSISQVRKSALFNAATTTFVEGPTQQTLPAHALPHLLQLALIDGPHGYPFPDLEYFYLYPKLPHGGLLLIDDLLIPSIHRMFDIVRADGMFELLEVVDDNTAFLRRTQAPLIDPHSDSWWLQGYNKPYYDQIAGPRSAPSLAPVPPTGGAPVHGDGWAGPAVVTELHAQGHERALVLSGSTTIGSGPSVVDVEAFVDNQSLGRRSLGPGDPFSVTWAIGRLTPGPHDVRLVADAFIVPHEVLANDDYRPLSYHVSRLAFAR
jgi:hypothetical protein